LDEILSGFGKDLQFKMYLNKEFHYCYFTRTILFSFSRRLFLVP